MTIEQRADMAANLKATGQCNCTQSVLKVFEDKIDIAPEEMSKLAAGFAAGMGCMESTCGALIGAVMVAGMATEGQGTPRYSREIVSKFQQKCGATICKDLKGIETGQVLCECPNCVRNAVLSLGEVMKQDPFYRLTAGIQDASKEETDEILAEIESLSDEDLEISTVHKFEA